MSRYVVAGGAGFIGSHLTESIVADGHEVLVLDNFQTSSPENLANVIENDRTDVRRVDITEPFDVSGPVDGVFHFAGLAAPSVYQENPIQTMELGSVATQRLLDIAVAHDASFLFASTSEVYGDPEVHPQPESYTGNVDPYGPRACYDESKRYAEALIRSYRERYGLDTHVVRIFNTYGPRLDDDRVIPTFVRQALADADVTVHGDGLQTRSFCYVDDLVRGIRLLMDSAVHEPLNLGNPDERHIHDLADLVIDLTASNSTVQYTDRPEDDPDVRCPDITRAEHALGWTPKTDLRDGLRQTIKHVQSTNP